MENSWHSYPSIFALGHRALENLFDGDVIVEEKIDGSQCSAGRFDGELRVRSKNKEMIIDAPEQMFIKAVEIWSQLDLHDGWTYRAEYLTKPKHGCLKYDRIPKSNLIIFDINTGYEEYLSYPDKVNEALRLGLEVVPLFAQGKTTLQDIGNFLQKESCLGGTKIEGVVIKNYSQFGQDKHVLMGKYVSEIFKEDSKESWRLNNPRSGDIIVMLADKYKTAARWQKAVQHLKEAGRLEESPRDIAALILETMADVEKECKEDIQEALWKWAWPSIKRQITYGLPEWYKEKLLESQFEK